MVTPHVHHRGDSSFYAMRACLAGPNIQQEQQQVLAMLYSLRVQS